MVDDSKLVTLGDVAQARTADQVTAQQIPLIYAPEATLFLVVPG